MASGTNVGTGNLLGVDVLKARGYTFVRLVSLPEHEGYATSLRDSGIAVLAVVIPAQSGGYVMSNADVHQFDNERDMDQSPGDYRAAATFYQRTYSNLTWISCGMASGQTPWWRNVQLAGGLPGFSGFAVHPYNKTPDQARTLLKSYQSITPQMDCWVTEWNRPAAEIPRMQKMLRENTVRSFWFCSDCGVPGFEEMPLIGRA